MGFQAFQLHDPLYLFWLSFAAFFSAFRYRWPRLQYLGLLGVVGLLVAVFGMVRFVPV